jgi:hypothetical protein
MRSLISSEYGLLSINLDHFVVDPATIRLVSSKRQRRQPKEATSSLTGSGAL